MMPASHALPGAAGLILICIAAAEMAASAVICGALVCSIVLSALAAGDIEVKNDLCVFGD